MTCFKNPLYFYTYNYCFNHFFNKPKSQIGGCVGGGVEFLWGKSARIASPLEIGVGKMPSIFSSINSIASETNKTTSAFYFNAGLRIYIGPRD